MIKKLFILFLTVTLLFSVNVSAYISSPAACTMDFESGELLYEKNSDTPMHAASLTKIMTLYIVFEKIMQGDLSFDTAVTISKKAAVLSKTSGISNVPFENQEKVSIETLIDSMVIVSACAACVAVAEHISGSEEKFTELMNTKAKELGLNAHFADSSGLCDDNTITPESVAALVKMFIEKYPQILEITKKAQFYFKGNLYKSSNLFLDTSGKHYLEGVDGFKTGTTRLAGKCLVATATNDSSRIISVLMKAQSDDLRYFESEKLIKAAFDNISYFNSHMFSTDIKTYVDANEIPCCYFLGRKKALCITAENLNMYGFDTYYDSENTTLYIWENNEKIISPITIKRETASVPVHKIYPQSSLKAVLVQNGTNMPLETVFSLNGQCCISVDEFGAYFDYMWDEQTRSAYIVTE